MAQLSRCTQHRARVANVRCVDAPLYLEHSDAARAALPVVLLHGLCQTWTYLVLLVAILAVDIDVSEELLNLLLVSHLPQLL